MHGKILVLSTVLACLLAISSIAMTMAANGPNTPTMKIWLLTPGEGVPLLESGALDIYGEPLTYHDVQTITSWDQYPSSNSNVTLDSHTDLGMCELDMNNQMWPTGDSNNKFYKPTSYEANASVAFRQAIACLTDRNDLVTSPQYLGGYGYRMDVPLPPFQSGYEDTINYTNSKTFTDGYSLIYNYNVTRATGLLDKYGFTIDPATGIRRDPVNGGDLKPLIFVIPSDDSILFQFGQNLATVLRSVGIPVSEVVGTRSICSRLVMSQYDYNLYLGKWSLGVVPDQYYTLYSSDNYYGPTVGGSSNYVGFCNNGSLFGNTVNIANDPLGYDYWANKVEYPADIVSVITACKTAGYLFLKYCASVPLYGLDAVEGYKTGTTGVVNNAGYGIDNHYTFLNGGVSGGQWNYGLESDPGSRPALNIITSPEAESESPLTPIPNSMTPAPKILNLMYESLMGANPFNLAQTEYWIAQDPSIGSWNATGKGGDSDATYINFTIRPNVYWHNGTTAGRNLDVYDINFSFYFTQACGPGVAWNYPSVKAFDHITIDAAHNVTSIYYLYKSAWAFLQACGLPILNRDTWGLLWNTTDPNWQKNVRNYDPVTMDLNHNGLPDIYEDGTGAWIFNAYVPNAYVTLNANPYYYLNQTFIADRIAYMFWCGAGDVNKDGVVNEQDLGLMARALFTNNVTGPFCQPPGWGCWNPACDLLGTGTIDLNDLSCLTTNYGKTVG